VGCSLAIRRWLPALLTSALAASLLTAGAATGTATASSPPAGSSHAPSSHGTSAHGSGFTIETVSNPRPQLVSGGEVLLRVTPPSGTFARQVSVTVNGHDATRDFTAQSDGTLLGLAHGLREGSNTVRARTTGHHSARSASLRVTDHPITGPVFSGPQQKPFYCQTTAYGLAPSVQPLCSAPTKVSYEYRSTTGAFVAMPDPAARPADLANATVGGHAVPYIVRIERGTIDRAVYETAALYDGSAPDPLRRTAGWNRKLVYTFGGGCNAGYHQGAATGGVLNDLFLSQGYAVASSSLNVLDNNCSPIISAEAAMMVKEHFIDTYGPVQHTIGWGGSGGAIQQYDIAENYPGIVDGIIPGVSFPDPLSTAGPVTDCRLMDQYFAKSGAAAGFTDAQKKAVAGFNAYSTCQSWDATFASRATATGSCDSSIPVDVRWDPVSNPTGVKCNSNEQLVNQLGRDPKTGFVPSPLDNVGVQYGLEALEDGQISAQQFADLNAQIGGIDYAGVPTASRTAADQKALATVYADDIFNSASQGLQSTPIIDQRTDLDFAGAGNDIHTTDWSFVMRRRLQQAGGSAANQVIIESDTSAGQTAAASAYELGAMDRWLTAVEADHSGRSAARKVVQDRPADLGDGCYLSATQRIRQTLTDPAKGQCGAAYPVAKDTRQVAGEDLAMNALKCSLTPLDFGDYPVAFTADQRRELRAAFPSGVCDYRRPGVGERAPRGTWLSYGD
jgi:hypothetical protein